ncbi:MAG: DegV family protein [Clostridia bacterium]|nr:DegV family protein [Clostridia bacterium]
MSKIKIICTSTGCIEYGPERYRDLGVDFIRIHIHFKGNEYLEGPDLDPVKFYEDLEHLENPRKNLPRTAMPAHAEISGVFDKAIDEGYDEAIVFSLSLGLGGTCDLIRLVAKDYEGRLKIHVIDTKVAGFSEGIHAIRAVEMVNKGYDAERILKETEWAMEHQQFYGVDAKLDYLIYNGRLKGAKAFMGQMLQICPVVRFDKDGRLGAVESVRTPKKALARMCEYIAGHIGDRSPEDYILCRTFTGPSLLEKLVEIEGKYGVKPNHEDVILSPVSGCHNGPWLAGYCLYFIRREDEAL